MLFDRIYRQLDRIEDRLKDGEQRFERLEEKIDEHASAHNGHPKRTFKGLTLAQWLIAALVIGQLAIAGVDPEWLSHVVSWVTGA